MVRTRMSGAAYIPGLHGYVSTWPRPEGSATGSACAGLKTLSRPCRCHPEFGGTDVCVILESIQEALGVVGQAGKHCR